MSALSIYGRKARCVLKNRCDSKMQHHWVRHGTEALLRPS